MTSWMHARDCTDPLTNGYGQPLAAWALAVGVVLIPIWILLALVVEHSGVRMDR